MLSNRANETMKFAKCTKLYMSQKLSTSSYYKVNLNVRKLIHTILHLNINQFCIVTEKPQFIEFRYHILTFCKIVCLCYEEKSTIHNRKMVICIFYTHVMSTRAHVKQNFKYRNFILIKAILGNFSL